MKNFFSYFFGAGEEVEFTNFSLAHFLPIIFMVAIIILIYIYRDRLRDYKHEDKLRLAMGLTLIITEMSYFWRLVGVESLNANPVDHLPITICGWAIIFASFMVVAKSKSLFDIVYFWVFAGSTFGLLTPTVITYTGPTRFRYYQFWLEHISGFIAIFYMIFVHKFRPNWKSIVKSYIALVILAVIAIMANNMLPGANYLFVARPEDTASILDFLPKNYIVRLILMAVVITLLFFVMYLPWLIKDIKAKKALATNTNSTNSNNITTEENNNDTDYRYVTKDESRDFHSRRRAFVIYENKLHFIRKGSSMSHWEFCQSKFPNMTKEEFNSITRGYYLDGDLVFYKDNFVYDNNVINEALEFVKKIKSTLKISNTIKIYFGLVVGVPGEDWPKDFYYGNLQKNNNITKKSATNKK